MWTLTKKWWIISPYVIVDKRCWNPLSLAGLQPGAKLAVLVDPRRPGKVMFT